MCQIIYKPTGKTFNFEAMDKAQKHNIHGYGLMWYEDDMVKSYRTMDYKQFKKVAKSLEELTCVAHMRHTTVGKTDINNCHPFEINTGLMMHNGTINSLNDGYSAKKSDSIKLSELLQDCSYNSVKDIEPLIKHIIGSTINRLVFMEDSGEVTIINSKLGIWEDGIWYSNDYHKKDEDWCRGGSCNTHHFPKKHKKVNTTPANKPKAKACKIFVYGTLKRGYGNNHLLKNATYLGKVTTADKWAMVGIGRPFPYVLEQDDDEGLILTGEVYAVDAATKERVDMLEGVPHHYNEQKVEIIYDDGLVEEVSMYVKTNVTALDRAGPYISAFVK